MSRQTLPVAALVVMLALAPPPAAAGTAATSPSLCLFTPHQAIELYVDGKRDGTLGICFDCGKLERDAVQALHPDALAGVFREFVVASGRDLPQDWRRNVRGIRPDSPDDHYRDPAPTRWHPEP